MLSSFGKQKHVKGEMHSKGHTFFQLLMTFFIEVKAEIEEMLKISILIFEF